MTMSKEDIIKIAEMNIDDLKKKRLKSILTCLGITAAIVAGVGLAKLAGMDYETLKTTGAIAMAANSGILGVTVPKMFFWNAAVKVVEEALEKYKSGNYDTEEEYDKFLQDALEVAGKTMSEMESRLEQNKGVSM